MAELDEYIRVVAMSADAAKRFFERENEPVDLGPPDDPHGRWRPGARVWGFRIKPFRVDSRPEDPDAHPDALR